MSTITSNTIVITAYPGKHGTINMSSNAEYSLLDTVDFDSDDSSNSSGTGGPKKRRRLTHLSPDEKLLRRKLKNRVAAQTARDRKKALMAELEEKVAQLEEENKLLKRQNYTLKEASSTLAKENAALKSRLSDSPLPAIKTESDTSRYVLEAGTDSVSVDGSVLHIGDNPEPDDFLCLLQEYTEDRECEKEKATTPVSQSVCGGNLPVKSYRANCGSATPRVVGLSSAELESLNELIQIDHVYVKPQPLNQNGGKEVQQKSSAALLKQETKGSIIPPLNKQFVILSGSKRNIAGEIVGSHDQFTALNPATPVANTESDYSRVSFTSATTIPSTLSQISIPSPLSVHSESDDFISTLSDSDMETSLNFFEDFDLNLIDSTSTHSEVVQPSSEETNSFFSLSQNTKSDTGLTETESDLNPTKLFDEIYEHYLSIKDSSVSSPESTAQSDSGISSDTEPLSPNSSDGDSFNDNLLWQDTSFADLFPDLQ
ncbi:unnamed protein product [Lymnaea stagnalis]|uniref:X-box-binding protein 1 n=1 Tax=Lymnaea stagnalis TaxID=6523 RepID=A0AAV2HJU8_LYMST